jgi:hypothetical protein
MYLERSLILDLALLASHTQHTHLGLFPGLPFLAPSVVAHLLQKAKAQFSLLQRSTSLPYVTLVKQNTLALGITHNKIYERIATDIGLCSSHKYCPLRYSLLSIVSAITN